MEQKKLGDASPLGLMGFGLTGILLGVHNAEFFPVGTIIFATGLFYGGIAQIIAGILQFIKGDTMGTTAFCSFGFFWIIIVSIWYIPTSADTVETSATLFGFFALLLVLFNGFLFIASLKSNKAMQIVLGSATLLFILVALGNLLNNSFILMLSGYEGILCGASAFYLAMATVVNEQYGREVMPIGQPK